MALAWSILLDKETNSTALMPSHLSPGLQQTPILTGTMQDKTDLERPQQGIVSI